MNDLLESPEIDTVPEFPAADASESKQRILTLRSPDELLAMRFDDSDVILGNRLLAKGQPLVIAAQGGTGKSRLALQLIAAIVSGRKFLSFDTGGSELRWLILQTENSNRRLQQDLARIKTWLGDDWPRFAEQVVFHTIENDDDGFVSLDSLENQAAILKTIESAKPDGIVIDPLNDFAAGDLNKDADMRTTLQTLSRLCRHGNPQRAMMVLHHSLTGKAGAVRATGYDRASFARNSKTLHAWARGQINLAPVDADNNERLIVACGKCSNGKEFPAFGVCLNSEMIYECDPSIDVSAWQSEMTGKPETANLSPEMVAEIVAELGKTVGAPKKPQIVKALRDETGCAASGAYKAIERAERAKKIHYTKTTKTYVTK
jgi:AAA domain